MACTLSNKCAKNISKQTVLLQLIIKNVVTCFLGTQCSRPLTEKRSFDLVTSAPYGSRNPVVATCRPNPLVMSAGKEKLSFWR